MQREKFGSRLGFILISAGCAIGLGNVYRFPIWCGAYGGGIFLLFYVLFLLLLGIPVMTAELSVGRASRRSIATSFDVLERKGQKWHWMKVLGVFGNYMLMMFYTTISGWFVVYFCKYLTGSIMVSTTAEQLGGVFGSIVTNPGLNIGVTALVILTCFGVCAMGLEKGVERITKVMMVMLLVLILGLGIYACTLPGAGAGFLFTTLSSIFNNMAGGRIIGTLFFLFMVFAALSTVIAVFENIMSFWLEWTKLRRWQIAIINVVLLFVLTMPFIFSNVGGFFAEKIFLGRNFGDFEDFLVSNMALPIGSLVYILFCTQRFGWGWKNYEAEVNAGAGAKVPAWMRPYMTCVLPIIIAIIVVLSLAG